MGLARAPIPETRTTSLGISASSSPNVAAKSGVTTENTASSLSNTPHIYLGSGDDDGFLSDNTALYDSLREANIAVTLDIQNGTHGWSFWRERVGTVLLFLGEALVLLEAQSDGKE